MEKLTAWEQRGTLTVKCKCGYEIKGRTLKHYGVKPKCITCKAKDKKEYEKKRGEKLVVNTTI